jgi:hypothetical protein
VERLDQAHRRLARGTEEDTPVRALTAVGAAVAIGVAIVVVVSVLIWVYA